MANDLKAKVNPAQLGGGNSMIMNGAPQ
jgi:hypothetical protein